MLKRSIKNMCLHLIFLFALTGCMTVTQSPQVFIDKRHNQIRIASYNVNWNDDDDHITSSQATIDAMKTINADVLVLQETTPAWQKLTNQQLANLYRYQYFYHDGHANGLAILSKYPIRNRIYVNPHIGWHPALIFMAYTPIGTIQIANLHLDPPVVNEHSVGFLGYAIFASPLTRLREAKYYYQISKDTPMTVIAGDFNESSEGSAMCYFRKMGYIDATYGTGMPPTWHWQYGLLTLRGHLDHILYSPDLIATQVQVLPAGDSDHYPVAVDFIKR